MKCTKCDNCEKTIDNKESKYNNTPDLNITLKFKEPNDIFKKRLDYIGEILKDEDEEPYDMDEKRTAFFEFCSINCLKEFVENNINTDYFSDWKEYTDNLVEERRL